METKPRRLENLCWSETSFGTDKPSIGISKSGGLKLRPHPLSLISAKSITTLNLLLSLKLHKLEEVEKREEPKKGRKHILEKHGIKLEDGKGSSTAANGLDDDDGLGAQRRRQRLRDSTENDGETKRVKVNNKERKSE
ncbi:hypothetical protein SO802_004340 [Lithocarpus litseifolius]|uniref:Uncharacterized protein n=1 Tax=Lithocarpus litseifolius TaxID=425828 RepID=A0AAW2E8B8_9ROSI